MMGKASLLLVMCLGIERWYSSVKPLQYRIRFSGKRLTSYIATIWILTCLFQLYRLFSKTPGRNGCQQANIPFGTRSLRAMIISYVIVTFIFPSLITWASFLHIWFRVRKSPAMNTASGNLTKVRLLRMCVLTALFLTLCWLPDQLYYVLSLFGITSLKSPIANYMIVLGLSNSCLNPWIYCLTNKEFCKEFRSLCTFRLFTRVSIPFKSSAYCLNDMKVREDLDLVFENPAVYSVRLTHCNNF